MRWLLVGGNGFIGTHLTKLLVKLKQHVTIFDNCSFSSPPTTTLAQVKYYTGDVGNYSALSAVISATNPDVICWMVAFHAYEVGEDPSAKIAWLNYTLHTSLPIVALAKSKFVLFSSELVYAPDNQPMTEEHPLHWGDLRSNTMGHLISEWYTTKLCTSLSIPYLILRVANVIGHRLYYHPVVDRLSFIIDNLILENPSLIITNPNQERDYIPVSDAVSMIYKIIRHGRDNSVYNIGSGGGVTNTELLQKLIDVINPSILPKVVDRMEPNIVMSNERAQEIARLKLGNVWHTIESVIAFRKKL